MIAGGEITVFYKQ